MAKRKKTRQKDRRHEQHRQRPARRRRLDPEPNRIPLLSDDDWRVVLRSHYRRRRRQKVMGWAAVVGGGLIAVNHFLAHVDVVDALAWLMSARLEDVVAGFPIATILAVVGVVLLGQRDDPPEREYTFDR